MQYSSNIDEITARMEARIMPALEKKVMRTLSGVTKFINTTIHTRVPVWSGQAVRNMIWSVGQPVRTRIEAIAVPQSPGNTSEMSLGAEPRRAANERAAKATYLALRFGRPFGRYYLTNNARDIGLIEDGAAPSANRSRVPAGAFRLTISDAVRLLTSGAFS
jgi:hypothetical protein